VTVNDYHLSLAELAPLKAQHRTLGWCRPAGPQLRNRRRYHH